MDKKRYEELTKKAEQTGEVSTDEYLEIMSYERPEYYYKLMTAISGWEEMSEQEFDELSKEIAPQDWELVQEQIDHAIGWDWE